MKERKQQLFSEVCFYNPFDMKKDKKEETMNP